MITTRLNDLEELHDGLPVVLCEALKGQERKHTCIRAVDAPTAGRFLENEAPLYDLDVVTIENGSKNFKAWVMGGSVPFGTVTSEHRLRLLLGEQVNIGEWSIKLL